MRKKNYKSSRNTRNCNKSKTTDCNRSKATDCNEKSIGFDKKESK